MTARNPGHYGGGGIGAAASPQHGRIDTRADRQSCRNSNDGEDAEPPTRASFNRCTPPVL